jgi:RNA polymerase sigma factor (sigma-70 family)
MKASLLFLSSDARVLDHIRKGDDEALVTLYQSSRRPVTAFVLRNSGTADDAEDMLQEALIVLWERVRSGRFSYDAKLDTFIFATAKNMWLRRLARARRELPGTPDAGATDDPSPLEQMIETEEAQLVEAALRQLGEPCRTLLLLFYWEELPLEEIAARLGFLNADTVKSKKYQCKKALQQSLLNC